MTPLLAQHFDVARERGQHMQVFLALGDQSDVERACRGNMPSRFVVQSLLGTSGAAHMSNKLRAADSRPAVADAEAALFPHGLCNEPIDLLLNLGHPFHLNVELLVDTIEMLHHQVTPSLS